MRVRIKRKRDLSIAVYLLSWFESLSSSSCGYSLSVQGELGAAEGVYGCLFGVMDRECSDFT